MSKSSLLMLILGLTAGCSLVLQTSSDGDSTVEQASTPATPSREYGCEPSAELLGADATLSDRAGRYRLTLVSDATDSGGTSRRVVSGLLTLRRQTRNSDSSASNSTDSSDSSSHVLTPLFGYTDVDPESVGAHRVGDPGSKDPSAPGVLVLERKEYGRRIITLRLGSLANRSDLVRYDGDYTALTVREIDEEGFAGNWRSGGGLGFSVTTGYFCALKVP